MTTRLLESTEMSTIHNAERELIVDTGDLKDLNHAEGTRKIRFFKWKNSLPKMQRKCRTIR